MKEVWRTIEDFSNYQISSIGRVKSKARWVPMPNCNGKRFWPERIMKSRKDKNGYSIIHLSNNGKGKTLKIHRLIAQAFICNLENKPCVNHLDGNVKNNNVENLEWSTVLENTQHAVRTGLFDIKGEKCFKAKLKNEDVLKIRELLEENVAISKIAAMFPISIRTIYDIKYGKTWKHI
jgi:hypothetical protein